MQVIQDPRRIPQSDLPLFVFSDSATDLVSFLITWKTKGNWNHVMVAGTSGKFAVQSIGYTEQHMDVYLKKGSRLDFYSLVNATPAVALAVQNYVSTRLAKPWWTKMYDWIGIFGQAIGFPKIHTQGLEYCSVDVTNCLKSITQLLPAYDAGCIVMIPDELNPQQLHDYMVLNPTVFKNYGEYESDEGITV